MQSFTPRVALARVIVKDSYTGKDIIVPLVKPSVTRMRANITRHVCPTCFALAEKSTKVGEQEVEGVTRDYHAVIRKCHGCKNYFYLVAYTYNHRNAHLLELNNA